MAFIANLSRNDAALRIGGGWRELLADRDVSDAFTLAPCEVLLIKEN